MSPRQIRFRLLLDEMHPGRDKFPNLNKLHDLKHIIHDFNLSGIVKDPQVVSFAKKENRILISKNEKHMVDLCLLNGVSLICVKEKIPNEEIDSKITAYLKKVNRGEPFVYRISKSPRKLV